MRAIAREVQVGTLDPAAIDEGTIANHLDTASFPDPDLVIRTGREIRLSNFLLWQSAYAELVFLEVNWPDFGRDALAGALETFAARSRRYGGRDERERA
jgi:undecaprenyl diphosphate synthase